MTHHRAPILHQFLVGERRRLVRAAKAEFDERARDLLADVVPRVLAVLAEVEALPAMADAFRVSRERVKYHNVQVGDYMRRQRCPSSWMAEVKGKLTVINVYIWPDRLPQADHARLFPRERRADEVGDLDRDGVRDAGFDEVVRREAVDRGRQHDVRARVALLVRVDNGQVDVAMNSVRRDGLDLVDIQVRVDGVGGEHALCRRGNDPRA